MQASILLILTAVTAALAAPKPSPQASCSTAKVNQCVSQVRFYALITAVGYWHLANCYPFTVWWWSL